jgi:hypothetical protein
VTTLWVEEMARRMGIALLVMVLVAVVVLAAQRVA